MKLWPFGGIKSVVGDVPELQHAGWINALYTGAVITNLAIILFWTFASQILQKIETMEQLQTLANTLWAQISVSIILCYLCFFGATLFKKANEHLPEKMQEEVFMFLFRKAADCSLFALAPMVFWNMIDPSNNAVRIALLVASLTLISINVYALFTLRRLSKNHSAGTKNPNDADAANPEGGP